jgi:hypothetical protein
LYIGGQLIDRQDSTFTEFLAPDLFAQNVSKSSSGNHGGTSNSYIYPFRYWFCENNQSALPLVALQYHDIELRIYWGTNLGSELTPPDQIVDVQVYAQYIYLDSAERSLLTKRPQDMLITQVQSMNPTRNKMMPIVFNHPVKYLCATSGSLTSNTNQLILQINGTDLADYKYASPHFTQAPTYYHVPFGRVNDNSYFLVPFCLDTSKFQPTGTLNFSRLDSFRVVSQSDIITNTVYGVNYNILRVQNGMGGLMYSN